MNQVLVQICFLVSGVVSGCAHVPYADVPAYSAHQVQYIVVENHQPRNTTSRPNWNNVKRSLHGQGLNNNVTPYVVRRSNVVFKRKNNRRPRRVVVRRHY